MKQEPLDKLTGVLTRESLEDMDAAFASRAPGEVWTVLMIDIDDFKIVNDIAGHLTGDRVLQQVAWLLARCVRQTDSVVRFGGDEFLVVLPATGALQAAGVRSDSWRRWEGATSTTPSGWGRALGWRSAKKPTGSSPR